MARPTDSKAEIRAALKAVPALPDEAEGSMIAAERRGEVTRVEALSLRLAGLSYSQIADRLGISSKGAQGLVERALGDSNPPEQVEVTRQMENARLDRAQAAIWTQVLNGELPAVDTYLRISQRRARMNGLDLPVKVDLSVSVRQEMEQTLAALEQVVLGDIEARVVEDDGDGPDDRDA